MIEVRVDPRRPDIHLVAGSLWFDQGSGSLVRASYKPARPFDLELIEPEDAEEVPGLLKPITAEIKYVTVEYSFHEFRYWLPRRFALEGEATVGRLLQIFLRSSGPYRDTWCTKKSRRCLSRARFLRVGLDPSIDGIRTA